MKRWQKAAVLLVITPLLAAAAWYGVEILAVWHFFFVAKCDGFGRCEDDGASLFSAVSWILGIAFTIYFFFAFRRLFGTRLGSRNAKGD